MPFRYAVLIFSFFLLPGAAVFLAPNDLWALRHMKPFAWTFLGAIPLFFLLNSFGRKITGTEHPDSRRFSDSIFFLIPLCSSAALAFFFFRQQLFLPPPDGLGDSLLLLETVPVFSHQFGYLDSFDELLELYLHSKLFLFLETNGWGTIHSSYMLLSIASGAAAAAALWIFLRKRILRDKIIGLCVLFLTPGLQLYAGYVENYSIASLFIFCVMAASCILLEKFAQNPEAMIEAQKIKFIAAVAVLAAAAALLHMIAGLLLPALVCLIVILSQRKIRVFIKMAAAGAVPSVIILAAVWSYFLFFSPNRIEFSGSHVSRPPVYGPRILFSSRHFLDFINLFLLACPAGMTAFIYSFAQKKEFSLLVSTPQKLFSLTAALTFAAGAFLIHPLLGYPADWDLQTFFRIPAGFFFFYFLTGEQSNKEEAVSAGKTLSVVSALFLASCLFTLPWLLRNSESSPASDTNIRMAAENVEAFLQRMKNDSIYPRIVLMEGKKLYVKVHLFTGRTRSVLAARPQKKELMMDLNRAEKKFDEIIMMDTGNYDREFPFLWNEMSRINQETAAEREKIRIGQ